MFRWYLDARCPSTVQLDSGNAKSCSNPAPLPHQRHRRLSLLSLKKPRPTLSPSYIPPSTCDRILLPLLLHPRINTATTNKSYIASSTIHPYSMRVRVVNIAFRCRNRLHSYIRIPPPPSIHPINALSLCYCCLILRPPIASSGHVPRIQEALAGVRCHPSLRVSGLGMHHYMLAPSSSSSLCLVNTYVRSDSDCTSLRAPPMALRLRSRSQISPDCALLPAAVCHSARDRLGDTAAGRLIRCLFESCIRCTSVVYLLCMHPCDMLTDRVPAVRKRIWSARNRLGARLAQCSRGVTNDAT